MYESPAYHSFKRTITHWEAVKRYVDLARTFRSMIYAPTLTLRSDCDVYGHGQAHTVELKDSLRTDALKFLAQRCEDIAAKMLEGEPEKIDVREASKV
jgi:hypothetical protein